MTLAIIDILSLEKSTDFQDATDAEVGIWLKLVMYCSKHENGGVIVGAKQWTPRHTDRSLMVVKEDLLDPSGMWSWQGDDLHVSYYPKDHQDRYLAKREAQAEAAKQTNEKRKRKSQEPETSVSETQTVTVSETVSVALSETQREEKRIEEKRREENGSQENLVDDYDKAGSQKAVPDSRPPLVPPSESGAKPPNPIRAVVERIQASPITANETEKDWEAKREQIRRQARGAA